MITLYTFEDANGVEQTYTTTNATEAREHGKRYGYRVIANQYEFSDSEVAWDFTPKSIAAEGNQA